MAFDNTPLTGGWQAVAGPGGNATIACHNAPFEYAIDESLPDAGKKGIPVPASVREPMLLGDLEILYVKPSVRVALDVPIYLVVIADTIPSS